MDREIKFRGMPQDEDRWLYGDLIRNERGTFAIVPPFKMNMSNECNRYEVDEDTVCQFTTWLDCNDREIYECDIVRFPANDALYEVIYNNNGFYLRNTKDKSIEPIDRTSSRYAEVIGTIFDFKL